jgi:anaerobic magnesium-protoporphyrin IX monomethyl ester cyclase
VGLLSCAYRISQPYRKPRYLWLDLGDPGVFIRPSGPLEKWQDHGLGLLRTYLERAGVETRVASTRNVIDLGDLHHTFLSADVLIMNVRSAFFPLARHAAILYKHVRPDGWVIVGGMHAAVALEEMEAIPAFDRICSGPGEGIIVDLLKDPGAFPRMVQGTGTKSMDDWPPINRELWPKPGVAKYLWPLEPTCGWGPPPVATILTSRACPWQCEFCNEASYLPHQRRRSPEAVNEELNELDRAYGPIGSVVIHDSMFFQHPGWLRQWLDLYPRRARECWPYWAACRSDTVRRWPDLFEALVRETNWNTISIGFESGSDRVMQILNKECTVADNYFAIELLNRIGDDFVRQGKEPPKFWANIMLAIPGETREDAFDTMRMLQRMNYKYLSPSFFTPYPGSVLGYQMMKERSSLLTADNYHRYPHDEKVRGIDYAFYRGLLAGQYDDEVARRPEPSAASTNDPFVRHQFYLFETLDGRRKLTYGENPKQALDILCARGGAQEENRICAENWINVSPSELPFLASKLE